MQRERLMESRLLDEASRPTLRELMGRLLTTALEADLAVTHVRLSAIDLTTREAAGMGNCRFLLGRLEASALAQIGAGSGRSHLTTLHQLLDSGRVEIRSAGVQVWLPDFSLYRMADDAAGTATSICLVGAHYFGAPHSALGPSLTCVMAQARDVELAQRRFEALWEQSHDVQPAVLHAIERLLEAG
jgi:hypothetical protein